MNGAKVSKEINHFWDAKCRLCAASDGISWDLTCKLIIFTCRWGTKSLTKFSVLVHADWNAYILARTSITRGCTRTFDFTFLTFHYGG